MSVVKLELECTCRCRSTVHGNAITAALSVRGASEEAMAAHLRAICANYCQVTDSSGRTALHMAATCGHGQVAQWLAHHRECNINTKDGENGFTPLHRSLFYGQIHVAINLIEMGASVTAVDGDELTAVEHGMLDRPSIVDLSPRGPCEVYVWGTNANYTLGTGSQQGRHLPELLEAFRKQSVSIKQVAMHKFHTVFVSHNGSAYSCGHGQGGRLGLGSEQAMLTPRCIKLGNPTPEVCVAASVSRDHTVLLTESGVVYTCGLNLHHQLGFTPPPRSLTSPLPLPQRVVKMGSVTGVCAARFHTVIWGPKVMLTFGLHAGQLGHPKSADKTIIKPKAVAAFHLKDSLISQVGTSDAAVVVATNKGQIFLLYLYECCRIATRQMDVAKVVVVGGQLDVRVDKEALSDQGGSQLQVLVLTTSGRLLIWREDLTQFTRCQFTLNRLLLVQDVAMTQSLVLFVTRNGEAFTGEIRPRNLKKSTPEQSAKPALPRHLERADSEVICVRKLPHVHRGISIVSDVKGRNFAVIQSHPKQALFDVPQLDTSLMRENMQTLLNEANEDDAIHDVVFQVGLRKFAAHQFIIRSRNDYLGKLISGQAGESGKVVTVKLDNMQPDVFHQVLQYIYLNECDMMTLGKCPMIVTNSNNQKNNNKDLNPGNVSSIAASGKSAFAVHLEEGKKAKKNKLQVAKNVTSNAMDPVGIVQRVAQRFNMSDLSAALNGFVYEDGFIVPKSRRGGSRLQPRWSRALHPELLDVVIRSESGRELRAHKCILTSRLEYFNSMFSQGWSEAKDVVKLALPYNILEILVDFLYEDDVSAEVGDSEDIELLSNLLVIADQLFVTRLKEQCEVSLVNVLTLKSAAELLQLADTYLAEQLKRCCMQYICFNLSAILEARSLERLSPKLLKELSGYYSDVNPAIQKRVLAPYFFAPSVETLQAELEANPFTFESQVPSSPIEVDAKKAVKRTKKKPKGNKAVDGSRGRKESTSSVASDDADQIQPISFDDLTEKPCIEESHKENIAQWVKIPTSKQQKIVQARLKAINASKEASFIMESSRESFTPLLRNSPSPSLSSPVRTTSPEPRVLSVQTPPQVIPPRPQPITTSDFPELCSTPSNGHYKSTPRLVEMKKPVKLSQKQRKRLTSLNDVGLMGEHLDAINQSPPKAWGRNSPDIEASSCSLVDIIRQELKQVRVSPSSDVATLPRKTEVQATKTIAMNPWGKMAVQEAVPVRHEATRMINFTDIVAHEKKGKDNLTKMLTKPLELTQIEDRAIKDLLQFYNASGSTDERITVQRVCRGPIAVPTWITNH